jgi:hypothetical protein
MTGYDVVDAISRLPFLGNITPHSWYHYIRRPRREGKGTQPDLLAIAILGDLVYWHRWREVRDDDTGKVARYEIRFRGEAFQRSRERYAEFFGVSVTQVRDALDTLRRLGLIHTWRKSVRGPGGELYQNRMFIAPVPERLEAINTLQGVKSLQAFNSDGEEIPTDASGTPLSLESADLEPPKVPGLQTLLLRIRR